LKHLLLLIAQVQNRERERYGQSGILHRSK
jgi:hypothetical protein